MQRSADTMQKCYKVLIIEDSLSIRKVLAIALGSAGFEAVECDNGGKGLQLAVSIQPDLILLDLRLPDMDGQQVIAHVREWSHVPIIVCSACSEDSEVIQALEAGADDYVTKPFNPNVLVARIHATLRKAAPSEAKEPKLVNGRLSMDLMRHEVYLDGKKTMFTPKEYALLHYFLAHCGKMLTHKQILKDVWGEGHSDDMQYLRVYISQLRDKVEPDSANPRYIVTESGIGYRMEYIAAEKPVSQLET